MTEQLCDIYIRFPTKQDRPALLGEAIFSWVTQFRINLGFSFDRCRLQASLESAALQREELSKKTPCRLVGE